jgi:hypothetical protein
MSKKLMLVYVSTFILSVIGSLGYIQVTHAHSGVEDPNTGIEASFHATPDHSPIAGSESVISFDFSKYGVKAADFTYRLTIKKVREKETVVSTEISSDVVIARYTFPTQGLYLLTLTATPKNGSSKPSVLTYSQRVSRGEVGEHEGFGNFELGVLGATLGFVGVVLVLAFSQKRIKHTKKKDV